MDKWRRGIVGEEMHVFSLAILDSSPGLSRKQMVKRSMDVEMNTCRIHLARLVEPWRAEIPRPHRVPVGS